MWMKTEADWFSEISPHLLIETVISQADVR